MLHESAGGKKEADGRPPWVRRMNRALWVLCPVLVLGGMEIVVRGRASCDWYQQPDLITDGAAVQVLFVGSSFVAAAVDAPTFAAEASKRLDREVNAVNLGKGYSTACEHYLGLRNLWTQHPEELRGCVVFVEAPMGLPFYETPGARWVHPKAPGIMVRLLRRKDLPALWRSATPFELKARLTTEFLLRWSELWNHRNGVRFRLVDGGTRGVERLLVGLGAAAREHEKADLAETGGIRTDVNALEVVRKRAVAQGRRQVSHQQPMRDWDRTVWAELVRFVRAHGGEVVFFRLPLSSVLAAPYMTKIRREDVRAFRRYAGRSGITILEFPFPCTDDEFPDLFHLRRSLSEEFTARLAQAWLTSEASPKPARPKR